MAGQPVQPAPTCMEHAHTLQLALNAELAERCFEQKQHMRILAELHVEIASLDEETQAMETDDQLSEEILNTPWRREVGLTKGEEL